MPGNVWRPEVSVVVTAVTWVSGIPQGPGIVLDNFL